MSCGCPRHQLLEITTPSFNQLTIARGQGSARPLDYTATTSHGHAHRHANIEGLKLADCALLDSVPVTPIIRSDALDRFSLRQLAQPLTITMASETTNVLAGQ